MVRKKVIIVSDKSGKELAADETVNVVVRRHPDAEKAKRLHLDPNEVKLLPGYRDDVELVVKWSDGTEVHFSCTAAEFDKFIDPETLEAASYYQGRQKGYSPNAE